MRILTYKRTHMGDPDQNGRFGIHDCMGRVRGYTFDAVIGIGGIGSEPHSYHIDRKINWVGITPHKRQHSIGDPLEITFENFLLLEEYGPPLESLAPLLAKRMYDHGARLLLDGYTDAEFKEARAILDWSLKQKLPKAFSLANAKGKRGCKSKCRPLVEKVRSC